MAHKNLVGGTAYEITGGKTLIGGTGYGISSGKTLIGGTGYDINFLLPSNCTNITTGNNIIYSPKIVYGDGYWVTNIGTTLYYTNSVDGEWTSLAETANASGITYINGYWIMPASFSVQTGSVTVPGMGVMPQYASYAAIKYTTDLVNGTWTTIQVSSSAGSTTKCITYDDGYYVVGVMIDKSPSIAYSTSLNGTWTTKTIWDGTGSDNQLNNIYHINGYWIAVGSSYTSSDNNYGNATFAYSTSIGGTWTMKVLWSSSYNSSFLSSMIYANGYYIAAGNYSQNGKSGGSIAYSTSLSGTWTTKDVWTGHEDGWSPINSIVYAKGYYVAAGYQTNSSNSSFDIACVSYSTSLSGTWTTVDLFSNTSAKLSDMIFSQGYFAAVGSKYYNGYNKSVYRFLYSPDPTEFANISFTEIV